jgi:NAD(P)-dependent dehydrogenase (short-subunit alcohol dehydrogenase family)
MATVLVTGSNKGIGFELVKEFSANGWDIIACCRKPKKADDLQNLTKNNKNIEIHKLDVEDFAGIDNLAEQLKNRSIDVLINNAGDYGNKDGQYFGNVDYKSWKQTFKINTQAPIKMGEAFITQIEKSGKKILATITSMMGSISLNDNGNEIIYRSTKGAANMALKCAANVLKEKGITVLILHPGWVKTDMGGPDAPVLPVESAKGLFNVITNADINKTGNFITYNGELLPW